MGVGLFSAHVCVLLSCFDGGSVTAPGLVSAHISIYVCYCHVLMVGVLQLQG